MLFDKKRTQQIKESVREALEDVFRQQDQKQTAQTEQMNQLCEHIEKNQKAIRKLSDTIEDFLDTFQEENTQINQLQQRIKESAECERRLVGLIGMYQDQMELLDQWINGDRDVDENNEAQQQAWKQQYNMLKGQVNAESRLCAIEFIGTKGESVDYRMHEVLQALETVDKDQEGTVAEVYSSGMLYKGKVIKKARVCAYRKG